ncbi:MAG TPA: carboxypeptidase-like regulatory domain-containing protein [Candidatus Angelobacter sp.]|nr:carboxypeptidase-like regulatory domain-containing protein [Candidatus Angelobacter sp.]
MKWTGILLPLALSLCAAAQTPKAAPGPPKSPASSADGSASAEGTVVNSITGRPLDGVHVMLLGFGPNHMPAVAYGAMSNSAGHFSITRIAPESYMIVLERRGFVFIPGTPSVPSTRSIPGTPRVSSVPGVPSVQKGVGANNVLKLKTGEQVRGLTLAMVPRSILSGGVLDEYGDPVMGAFVLVLPQAREAPAQFATQVTTNDRGDFRMAVPPGRYYVKAKIWPSPGSGPAEIRTDGSSEANYPETYYPSATETGAASLVEARPAYEQSGIEIRLAHSPVLSISGTISGIPDGFSFVTAHAESGPYNAAYTSTTEWEPSKFQIGHLGSAVYRVYARCKTGDRELQSQIVEIALTDSSVENVNLALEPGYDVTGSIEPLAHGESRTVKLHPAGSRTLDRYRTAEASPDGTFTIKNVFAERYRVEVDPLPENGFGFIKSVRVNGTPVPDGVLDFSAGAEGVTLKIALSPNGAQITGHVEYGEQEDLAPFTVLLFPDQENVDAEQCRRDSTGGGFSFKGLAPGRYRLLALSSRTLAPLEVEDAIKRHGGSAEVIEIKEGEKMEKNVKPAAHEEANGLEK